MADEEIEPTPEEIEALGKLGYGYPQEEERQNIYTYFKQVIFMPTNTKTGNLTNEELGFVRIPVRTNQEIALLCKALGMKGFGSFFEKEAQITLGTSLSREGHLNKLAVTQKREVETKSRVPKNVKRGWFTPKSKEQELEM